MTTAEQRPAASYSRASSRPKISRHFVSAARAVVFTMVVVLLSTTLAPVAPAGAAMSNTETLLANEFFAQLNAERSARSLPPLTNDTSMATATRQWAEKIEDDNYLRHSSDGRAEIIAYGNNTGQITDAWMRSSGHRNLITDPNLVPTSVSVECGSDGRIWAVVQFRRIDRTLATQSSSPSSPIATPSSAGGTCAEPPSGATSQEVNSIKRLYRAYYLRDADSGGLDYWRQQAASGMSIWRISDHFAEANEFNQRYGRLGNRAFVDLVYENVMGRSADSAGERFWIDQLRNGMSRGELMTYFSDSPEYRNLTGLY